MITQNLRRSIVQPGQSAEAAAGVSTWNRLFQLPTEETIDEIDTEALLDAVLSGQATAGGPRHLADRGTELRTIRQATPVVPATAPLVERQDIVGATGAHTGDTAGPRSRRKRTSRAGAFVATTAGQIALCTAVAAASVGGVYAATDRIDGPGAPDRTDVADVSAAPDATDIAGTPSSEWLPEIEILARDAHVHETEVLSFVIATDIGGCEGGRAIARLASANAGDRPQVPEPGSNPCGPSEQARSAAANSGPENRKDHDIEGVEMPEAASNGSAEAAKGREERGHPATSGKPDRSGRGK